MSRPPGGRRRGVQPSSVIGAAAGVLTVAAVVAALQTGLPAAAGSTALSATGRSVEAADEASLSAGPLAIPGIGVVAPGFDDPYLTLATPPPRSVLVPRASVSPSAEEPPVPVVVDPPAQVPVTPPALTTPPAPEIPSPTGTPSPTETPLPTETPSPTETPLPTETPSTSGTPAEPSCPAEPTAPTTTASTTTAPTTSDPAAPTCEPTDPAANPTPTS